MDRFHGVSIADERASDDRERRLDEALDALTAAVANFRFYHLTLLEPDEREALDDAPDDLVIEAIIKGLRS